LEDWVIELLGLGDFFLVVVVVVVGEFRSGGFGWV
jgi:hypothetical protein